MSDPMQDRLEWLGRSHLKQLGLDEAHTRKVIQRAKEALDATSVKVGFHEGAAILGPEQIDFTERRLAVELNAKLLDMMPNKVEHEVHGDVKFTVLGLEWDGV